MTTKVIKCETCGALAPRDRENSPPTKSYGPSGWSTRFEFNHDMVVISVMEKSKNKRVYHDFCALECARKWLNNQPK